MPSIQAAIAVNFRSPLIIRELDLGEPKGDEVLVRTVASGVCHTDLLLRDGVFGPKLPAVPGHEGAGIVEAVGPSVRSVRVADHVLLTQASCGWCRSCRSALPMNCQHYAQFNVTGRRANGSPSYNEDVAGNFIGQSSFATYMLASESSAVVLPRSIPLHLAAPLGCGLTTGASTVLNVMKPPPGASIVIFGAGAVGLAAVMAAKITGCSIIVVVDLHRPRLDLALALGATHVLNGKSGSLAEQLRSITGDGAGYGVDAVGLPQTLEMIVGSVRPGGHVVLLGANGAGSKASIDLVTLLYSRRVEGAILGNQIPQVTIPELLALYEQGRFPIEKLVTRYPFADINRALDDAEAGIAVKPVLLFD